MSINDLMEMNFLPIVFLIIIAGLFFWMYYMSKYSDAKNEYDKAEIHKENDVKVISKDKGEKITIGGTIVNPIKGYKCTFVFEKNDGTRLVLKTSKSEIYDAIIIGDVGNIHYKNGILIEFQWNEALKND